MISGTVIDKAGRNLSGQTVEAFLVSMAHARPLILGLNCSLGPDEMESFIEELSRIAPFYVGAYPNAGLPDPLSPTGFPETPESFAPKLASWMANGWLNLVGGCCGTTPEHIRAIANAVRDCKPRRVKPRNPRRFEINFMNQRAKTDIVDYALKELLIFAPRDRFTLEEKIVQTDGGSAEGVRFDYICARVEVIGMNLLDHLRLR